MDSSGDFDLGLGSVSTHWPKQFHAVKIASNTGMHGRVRYQSELVRSVLKEPGIEYLLSSSKQRNDGLGLFWLEGFRPTQPSPVG
jgi:hypothetical protein